MTPTVLLLGGGLLLVTGATLALAVVGGLASGRREVAASLAAVRALDAGPGSESEPVAGGTLVERVIAPAAARLAGPGRRLARPDATARIQRRLDIAGDPAGWDVDRIVGAKLLALVTLGGLVLCYASATVARTTTRPGEAPVADA